MRFVLIFIVLWLAACDPGPKYPHALYGKWQSNAEKTLASMRATEGIPDKDRAVFENDYFGYITVNYGAGEYLLHSTRYTGQQSSRYAALPYELVEETDSYFVVRYFSDDKTNSMEQKIYREGDCYYIPVPDWGFKEYFCRVPELN